MSVDRNRYTYENAGYNGFFRRTISSNPTETSLKNVGANRVFQPTALNLDNTEVSGSLSDTLRVGKGVEINGPEERVSIINSDNEEVVRLGRAND